MNKSVYIGIRGSLICYDIISGKELWRTHLKGSGFVSIYIDDDIILAHTGGHLFGVKKSDGSQIWENKMKGLGYGLASISTMGPGGMEEMAKKITEQKAGAGAAGSAGAATSG